MLKTNPMRADPLAISVRPVRQGDEISVMVEGGFHRDRAGSSGIIVATADRDIYIPLDMLTVPLAELGCVVTQVAVEVSEAPAKTGRVRVAKRNGRRG